MVRLDEQNECLEVSFQVDGKWCLDEARRMLACFAEEYGDSDGETARIAVSRVRLFDVGVIDVSGMLSYVRDKLVELEKLHTVYNYHDRVRYYVGEYLDGLLWKEYREFPDEYVYTIKDFA